jgi:hypothetical protein
MNARLPSLTMDRVKCEEVYLTEELHPQVFTLLNVLATYQLHVVKYAPEQIYNLVLFILVVVEDGDGVNHRNYLLDGFDLE